MFRAIWKALGRKVRIEPKDLAAEQLHAAELGLLNAEFYREHYDHECVVFAQRIERLRQYLKDELQTVVRIENHARPTRRV